MNIAKLVTITPDAEQHIAYCARVSSPNQENPEITRLLKYCISHKHWSIFEMAHMVIEIKTSRAIAAQILRHRSFSFQEFSQRYAPVPSEPPKVISMQRLSGSHNRQSSLPLPEWEELTDHQQLVLIRADEVVQSAFTVYNDLLQSGFATETARMILPLATPTRMYMAGNIRDWLHYVDLRTQDDTQYEHRQIANDIKLIIEEQLPTIYAAMWNTNKPTYDIVKDIDGDDQTDISK
jgi:thymidylate synthase (FAD)